MLQNIPPKLTSLRFNLRFLRRENEDLHESEERYRQLVELSPDAIIVHTEGKVVYTNASGLKLFGAQAAEELVGKTWLDLIHPEVRDLVRERIRRIDLEGATTPLQEYRILRMRGGAVDIEATGTLVTYQRRPSNLVIIRDISARKQAERELRALNERLEEEKTHRKLLSKRLIDLLEEDRREVAMEIHDRTGQMLTMLKMDLENILSELKGMNKPFQNRLESAIRTTSQAMDDFKKIAHELMPRMIENLGLIPSLRAMFKDIEGRVEIRIYFFYHGFSERFARNKEMAIYRIVQEALLNVVKHARAGRVFVNLLRKPQTVSLSIEDDGIGFDPEEKMRISRTGGPLGLHIMRERAVHLGGELFIESRLGGGTYLLVEIPTNSARTTLASEQAGDAVVQYEHSHSR